MRKYFLIGVSSLNGAPSTPVKPDPSGSVFYCEVRFFSPSVFLVLCKTAHQDVRHYMQKTCELDSYHLWPSYDECYWFIPVCTIKWRPVLNVNGLIQLLLIFYWNFDYGLNWEAGQSLSISPGSPRGTVRTEGGEMGWERIVWWQFVMDC